VQYVRENKIYIRIMCVGPSFYVIEGRKSCQFKLAYDKIFAKVDNSLLQLERYLESYFPDEWRLIEMVRGSEEEMRSKQTTPRSNSYEGTSSRSKNTF